MSGSNMLIVVFLIQYIFLCTLVVGLITYCITNWGVILVYNKWSEHVPLPPVVEKSQLLMLVATGIALGWLVISSCTIRYWRSKDGRKTVAFAGITDLILATMMLTAVILQSTYLPRTRVGCNNYNGQAAVKKMFSHEAERVSNAAESTKNYTSRDICHSFMTERTVAIVMITFFLIAAILGIFNPKWKYLKQLLMPFWWFLLGIRYVTKPIWAVLVFIWPSVRWVLVVLSLAFKSPWFVLVKVARIVRFAVRRHRKWNGRLGRPLLPAYNSPRKETPDSSASDVVLLKKLSKRRTEYPYSVPNTKFESLLNDDKILQAFIQNSHLSDLSRLTSTSKFLHQRLMTAGEEIAPLSFSAPEFLRWKSCQQGKKAQCWCCGIAICEDCSIIVKPGIPQTSCHLQYCEPRCSKCYFENMCVRKSRSKLCMHLRNRYMKIKKQKVCFSCSQLAEEERLTQREEKEMVELQHLARHNLRCGLCTRRLPPTGPRWWGCSECGSECTVDYHPAWSKSPS